MISVDNMWVNQQVYENTPLSIDKNSNRESRLDFGLCKNEKRVYFKRLNESLRVYHERIKFYNKRYEF